MKKLQSKNPQCVPVIVDSLSECAIARIVQSGSNNIVVACFPPLHPTCGSILVENFANRPTWDIITVYYHSMSSWREVCTKFKMKTCKIIENHHQKCTLTHNLLYLNATETNAILFQSITHK